MTAIQILALLLAVSASLHAATATTLLVRRNGVPLGTALLAAAGAAGTTLGIYLAGVQAYR